MMVQHPPNNTSKSKQLLAIVIYFSLINLSRALSLPTRPSLKPPSNAVSPLTSSNAEGAEGMPFIVQRVSLSKAEEFRDISNICIDVFFNDGALTGNANTNGASNNIMTPWKSVQLSYLRHMQYSDLRTRKFMGRVQNEMFIARRVYPASDPTSPELISPQNKSTPIFNIPSQPSHLYEAGDVIGFVEVTARAFGLPSQDQQVTKLIRPVIANLAVRPDARKFGVGSKLVDTCEDIVQTPEWGFDEVVLQVEEDNEGAQKFYDKRDYKVVFADPATLRYDTSGILLRQVRSTKICMRKDFSVMGKETKEINTSEGLGNMFRNFFMDVAGK